MASNFAIPSAPSSKRALKKPAPKIHISNLRQSSSASNIFESRQTRKPRSTVSQDKENRPPVSMLAQSLELSKIDGLAITECGTNFNNRMACSTEILATPQIPSQHSCFIPNSQVTDPSLSHDLLPPQLQIIRSPRLSDCRSISVDTMADLMHSTVQQRIYDRIVIIDCRFPYEFDGGHIKGAVNITNADDLENLLLESEHLAEMGSRLCLIFHCEFSSQRGPKLFRHLRNLDRKMNADRYPALTFPETYLLEGGYREFFAKHRGLCFPDQYVQMNDPNFADHLKEAMKEHNKLNRRHRSRSMSELDFGGRKKRAASKLIGGSDSNMPIMQRSHMYASCADLPSFSPAMAPVDEFHENQEDNSSTFLQSNMHHSVGFGGEATDAMDVDHPPRIIAPVEPAGPPVGFQLPLNKSPVSRNIFASSSSSSIPSRFSAPTLQHSFSNPNITSSTFPHTHSEPALNFQARKQRVQKPSHFSFQDVNKSPTRFASDMTPRPHHNPAGTSYQSESTYSLRMAGEIPNPKFGSQ